MMISRKRWLVSSLAGLLLTAVAGLAYAAATEQAAAGAGANTEAEDAQVRRSVIKLVLGSDGTAEHLELANLHELEVGESRALTTESGTPVVVTRDAEGFEIDLDGKKIRLTEHFSGKGSGGSWTSEDGSTTQFHKRIVVRQGDDDGGTSVMILRNKVAADESGAVIAGVAGPDTHAFAFTTGGGDLPTIALPVEVTIRRLEASAKFKELDEATRAKVIEALRESAPKPEALVAGEPGSRTMVIEIEDEERAGEEN